MVIADIFIWENVQYKKASQQFYSGHGLKVLNGSITAVSRGDQNLGSKITLSVIGLIERDRRTADAHLSP